MKHGSLFSGIGGFDLGFERVGMTTSWQVEIDNHCQQLLEKRWPDTERMEDVRTVTGPESVDLISGGFPCQDVSVAGRRAGLSGERSGLWFEFHRILETLRPSWVVVENVPGLLSSNGGQDFAVILRGLAELGYGVTYRILDAQYFGVPQRRRRIFIVGHLGTHRAIEVLFERESLSRNFEAGSQAGQEIARAVDTRSGGASGKEQQETFVTGPLGGGDHGTGRRTEDDPNIVYGMVPGNSADSYGIGLEKEISPPVRGGGAGAKPTIAYDVAAPLRSRSSPNSNIPGRGGEEDENIVVAINENQRAEIRMDPQTDSIKTGGGKPGQGYVAALTEQGVRRLMPIECERLQGFPDNWTSGFSDTARYKMLGNAVCVPVVEWLGKRIMDAHDGLPLFSGVSE